MLSEESNARPIGKLNWLLPEPIVPNVERKVVPRAVCAYADCEKSGILVPEISMKIIRTIFNELIFLAK